MSNPDSQPKVQQVTAQIGGLPTVGIDVPICAVFIPLFLTAFACHMTLFRKNSGRGHKFIFNGMCCGYSMSRVLACVFRLIWATKPTDTNISLVASIFLNAGILIVYLLNDFLAWRLVRCAVPTFGWNRPVRLFHRTMLYLIIPMIVSLIVIIVLRVKSPHLAHINTAANVLTKLAQTYFLIIASAPIPLIIFAYINGPHDPFGVGSWNGKVIVLSLSVMGAVTEAGFRCGTAWAPAPLASNPAWWDSRAAFYLFNFSIDIVLLALLLIGRIDKRFYIPNGAEGPMSYSREGTPRAGTPNHEEEMRAYTYKAASFNQAPSNGNGGGLDAITSKTTLRDGEPNGEELYASKIRPARGSIDTGIGGATTWADYGRMHDHGANEDVGMKEAPLYGAAVNGDAVNGQAVNAEAVNREAVDGGAMNVEPANAFTSSTTLQDAPSDREDTPAFTRTTTPPAAPIDFGGRGAPSWADSGRDYHLGAPIS